jgi:2-haloacid dehalogenase
MLDPTTIRALAFDVFGTVVDWHGSIVRGGAALDAVRGRTTDWGGLAAAWRAGYPVAMDRVRQGGLDWTSIDVLHRQILDSLLPRFGLEELDAAERAHLNRIWHRLAPWPDSVAGLQRLKARFVITTLSNGNVSLLVDMAKHAGLPWDCVLSAELFRHYKPDREVYIGAAALLDVAPAELMLVAAHPSDLDAAQRAGLKTAFVRRPLEYGPSAAPHAGNVDRFDLVADDFGDLAQRLGA